MNMIYTYFFSVFTNAVPIRIESFVLHIWLAAGCHVRKYREFLW